MAFWFWSRLVPPSCLSAAILVQSWEDFCASGWSLSGKTRLGKKPCLGSFVPGEPLVGWLLFSFRLGEISASLVGRCQEKPFLGEKPFLSSFTSGKPVVWEKPVLSSVLIGVGRHSLFFTLYRSSGDFCVGKTHLGKKPLSCWEKPSLWRVLVLLAMCSLPVFGRFLRFQLLLGKNSSWEKNLSFVRKTHGFFGKNLFTAAYLLGKSIVILGKTCRLFLLGSLAASASLVRC